MRLPIVILVYAHMGGKATTRKYSRPDWATRTVEQLRQVYKGCVQAGLAGTTRLDRMGQRQDLCPSTGSTFPVKRCDG